MSIVSFPVHAGRVPFGLLSLAHPGVALATAEVACAVVLFAGVTSGLGLLMQSAGTELLKRGASRRAPHIAGTVMRAVGEKMFLFGKYTFLSVSVPTYIATWIFPKWLVLNGIPSFYRHVLIPLRQGFIRAVDMIGRVALRALRAVCTYVLEPIGRFVCDVLKQVRKIVVLVAKGIQFCIEKTVEAMRRTIRIFRDFVLNLINLISIRIRRIVALVADKIRFCLTKIREVALRAIRAVCTYVLEPLGHFVSDVIKQVRKIVVLAAKGIRFCLTKIGEVALRAIRAVCTYVLEPLGRLLNAGLEQVRRIVVLAADGARFCLTKIGEAARLAIQAACTYVVEPLKRLINAGLEQVRRIAALAADRARLRLIKIKKAAHMAIQAAYTHVLKSVGDMMSASSKWVWNSVIIPSVEAVLQAGTFITSEIGRLAQKVHRSVIVPMEEISAHIVQTSVLQAASLMDSVRKGSVEIVNSVRGTYTWLSSSI